MMTCAHPLCSSIVRKGIVGLTGALMIVFVLGHMTGNLLIFLPPEAINSYAEFLHEAGHGALIWLSRLGLLTIFAVHIGLTISLKYENKKARPIAYAAHQPLASNWASRHMLLTGLVVLLFVVYHLLHFTAGVTDHSADWRRPIGGPGRPHLLDVHSMVVNGFQNPYIASFYIVCQIVLGMHLWHGGSSLFQSLGINRGFWKRITAWAGPVVAVIVVVGNCSIPIAIQARFIQCQADIEMKKAEIDFRNGKLPRLWSPANGGSASASQPH